jgi:hypothetical protein
MQVAFVMDYLDGGEILAYIESNYIVGIIITKIMDALLKRKQNGFFSRFVKPYLTVIRRM